MSAPTLAEWLVSHPFDNPETIDPPDVDAAYHLNAGENVLADVAITDNDNDPIPEEDVVAVTLSLRRNEAPVITWSWTAEGPSSDQIEVANGHIYLEISKADSEDLAGLYDFVVQLSIASDDFFYSEAQTDVRETRATLFIRKAVANPLS